MAKSIKRKRANLVEESLGGPNLDLLRRRHSVCVITRLRLSRSITAIGKVGGSPKLLAKLRIAYKSADGACRHSLNKWSRAKHGE